MHFYQTASILNWVMGLGTLALTPHEAYAWCDVKYLGNNMSWFTDEVETIARLPIGGFFLLHLLFKL